MTRLSTHFPSWPLAAGLTAGLVVLAPACLIDGTGEPEPEPDPIVEPDPEPEIESTEDPLPGVIGLEAMPDANEDVGIVEYTLRIDVSSVELLPGTGETSVWAYNDAVPGPLLQARVGEKVRITAINNLDEPTTIHWHGLRIDYRMDGVVYGSLPAIGPGETFVYEFVPPEAGTFWYHPHMRTTVQVERGLYGMFIVHERPEDRPDVDADRAFVLDDIRLNNDGSIAPFASSGMDIIHGRSGNVMLINGSAEAVAIDMAPGAVERWRLVNTSNARTMTLRFPGLDVREIGSDGGLWPQALVRSVDEITLAVGARAELEVRLADGSSTGTMDNMVFTRNDNDEIVLAPIPMAQVTATDTPVQTPRAGHTADPELTPITARLDVDKRIQFDALNIGGQIVMTINGEAYPNVPLWTVEQGKFQVIRVVNGMPQNEHPFHLHGQFFQILERNGQPTDEPGWRDTVNIPAGAGQSVTIATWFDNPGSWLYHCHILEHADAGMMAVVEVDPRP